ncbi:hypothetical protein KIPB_009862 [Kipferlia bialata]|uniref:Uncharacterized protein n=1 Tax=Kipferlia bialata TaxID=797122 RepID=A0A9K3D4X1_9EUKA|nr:hypothetical protein KIPB_009862 [Kipferlia bialata]|eukprot:g9862.t1
MKLSGMDVVECDYSEGDSEHETDLPESSVDADIDMGDGGATLDQRDTSIPLRYQDFSTSPLTRFFRCDINGPNGCHAPWEELPIGPYLAPSSITVMGDTAHVLGCMDTTIHAGAGGVVHLSYCVRRGWEECESQQTSMCSMLATARARRTPYTVHRTPYTPDHVPPSTVAVGGILYESSIYRLSSDFFAYEPVQGCYLPVKWVGQGIAGSGSCSLYSVGPDYIIVQRGDGSGEVPVIHVSPAMMYPGDAHTGVPRVWRQPTLTVPEE